MNAQINKDAVSLRYYLASAGTGKTSQLVENFYQLLLTKEIINEPKKIAAITALTFTRKAANVIKERIVKKLRERNNNTQKDFPELLIIVLHNYDYLQVATIDSFLLRLVSPFAVTLGLPPDFEIELNRSLVIKKSLELLLNSLQPDDSILKDIIGLISEKLQEKKSWRIDKLLSEFLLNASREESRTFFTQLNPNELQTFTKKINQLFTAIKKEIAERAQTVLARLEKYSTYSEHDKLANYLHFIKRFCDFPESDDFEKINNYLKPEKLNILQNRFKVAKEIIELIKSELSAIKNFEYDFLTLKLIRENLGPLQLYFQVTINLKTYCQQRNIVFLEDLLDLTLNKIECFSEIPLAEFFGSKIEHFLIDEFQDTSRRQWELLAFFISEALSNGNQNDLFGDLKQAIYRWRNSDWRIYHDLQVDSRFKNFLRPIDLSTNFRSSPVIIDFARDFFSKMIEERNRNNKNRHLEIVFRNLTSKPAYKFPGAVKAEIISNLSNPNSEENSDEDNASEENNLKAAYLSKIKQAIEELKKDGFKLNEIALLLRTNLGCQELGEELAHDYPIASTEALQLNKSLAVNLLHKLFFWFFRKNKEEIGREINLLLNLREKLKMQPEELKLIEHQQLNKLHPKWEEFLQQAHLFSRSLYFLAEELIAFFDLNRNKEDQIYLNTFLNTILQFQKEEISYSGDFLDWWQEKQENGELTLDNCSIEALNILTCHKAKGLEFNAVIVALYKWESAHAGRNYHLLEVEKAFLNKYDFQLSRMVVKDKKEVTKSAFASSFHEEQELAEIDDFNLLYVACTRPRQRLYLFSEQPRRKKESFLELVNQTIKSFAADGKLFLSQSQQEGLISEFHKQEESSQTITINWRAEEQGSKNPLSGLEIVKNKISFSSSQLRKKEEGRLFHRLLENLSPNHLQSFIESNTELKIAFTEVEKFLEPLRKDFPLELVEREIYHQKHFLRPDRILLNSQGEFVLIDFKTGRSELDHQNQLKLYRQALENAGYIYKKSFLVYLAPFKVEEL